MSHLYSSHQLINTVNEETVNKKTQCTSEEIGYSISERTIPKYKINPFVQMCRYMLTLKSHPVLMNEINRVLSPRRKFDSI